MEGHKRVLIQNIVLKNGFQKKSQKTPLNEILLAEKRKADWLRRFR